MTRPPARNGVRRPARASMRRVGPEELVPLGDLPPLVGEDAHRHDRAGVDAVRLGPRRGGPPLRLGGVAVGVLLRQLRERVVQVLGRLAHDRSALVDQPLGDEAGVEVDVVAHRMVSHVLHAAGDREVAGAHRDLTRGRGDGGERAGAHAIDREAGDGVRQPREERHVTAERQALVADLRRRGHHDVADPLGRRLRVAAKELAHRLHGHVVGARLPEEPARAGFAECCADAVDVDDLTQLPRHGSEDTHGLTDRSIRERVAILRAWTGRRSSRGPTRSTSDG